MLKFFAVSGGVVSSLFLTRKIIEYSWGRVHNQSTLKGKLFIVTGANTGLGFETSKALAARGATVIMACRNMDKANEAIKKIKEATSEGELIALELDLASFESIKKFCAKIKAEYPVFDCLINNAGVIVNTNEKTKEGFELQCGTNHLGHFLLTNLLKYNIKQNGSRVVIVSSKMHECGTIDLENLGKFAEKPRGMFSVTNGLYSDSKLMNSYFAKELYKKGVDFHVCCPGLCDTDIFRDYNLKFYIYIMYMPILFLFLRSTEQGAQNIIHCATDNVNTEEQNPDKSHLIISLKQTKSKLDLSDEISEKLWIESAKLCGIEA